MKHTNFEVQIKSTNNIMLARQFDVYEDAERCYNNLKDKNLDPKIFIVNTVKTEIGIIESIKIKDVSE